MRGTPLPRAIEFVSRASSRSSGRTGSPAAMLRVRAALRALSPVVFSHLRTTSFYYFGSSGTARYRRFCGTMSALATVDTTQRLQALRELMAKPEYNIQAVVIPTEDQRE